MTSFTYDTLLAALLSYTEDQSTEFASALPTVIKMGQDKVVRDLDLEIFKGTIEGTFTSGSSYQDKPEGLLTITDLHYFYTPFNKLIRAKPRGYDFILGYVRRLNKTGQVLFYYEGYSDSQILVGDAPSAAYVTYMRGIRRPNYISPDVAENWVSKYAGDLLLYACLMESESFLFSVQEGKPQEWERLYNLRLPQARAELGSIARMEYAPQQSNEQSRTDG